MIDPHERHVTPRTDQSSREMSAPLVLALGVLSCWMFWQWSVAWSFGALRCGRVDAGAVSGAREGVAGAAALFVIAWIVAAVRAPHRVSVMLCTVAAVLVALAALVLTMPTTHAAQGFCF